MGKRQLAQTPRLDWSGFPERMAGNWALRTLSLSCGLCLGGAKEVKCLRHYEKEDQ